MSEAPSRRFERYVALGDSSTEGLNDPDGSGGYRGWSRRLAARIADEQGGLLYANFGVRGLTTRQILDQQVEPAAAMQPDLVTVFSGTNDVIGRRFDARLIAHDMEHIQRTFIDNGATVLTVTLPDLTPIMPIARWIAPRIRIMNEALRTTTARTGATLLDFSLYPVAIDPRLWHEDRLHANALGHTRIADALAFALELPGTDDSWGTDLPLLPPQTLAQKIAAEVSWWRRYLLPWIGKGASARIMAGNRGFPVPTLAPFLSASGSEREDVL
jgi:lysophospholipase L1-like esterase